MGLFDRNPLTGNLISPMAANTTGGGGSGADTYLSNLTAPTAINQDLIFNTGALAYLKTKDDSAATRDLWIATGDSTGASTGDISIYPGYTPVGSTGGIFMGSNNSTTGDAGGFEFFGGNSGAGNSGDVNFVIGSATVTQGNFKFFKTGIPSVVGQVWTASGVDGEGYWDDFSLGANSVNGTNIRLADQEWLRSRNEDNDGDVNLIRSFGDGPQIGDGTVGVSINGPAITMLSLGQARFSEVETSNFWGGEVDALVFDSGTLINSGHQNEYAFIMTSDNDSGKSAHLQLLTGAATVSGQSGGIFIQSGDSAAANAGVVQLQGGAGATTGGHVQLNGGGGSGGTGGNIELTPGAGTPNGRTIISRDITTDYFNVELSDLIPLSWFSLVPAIVIDGTTTAAQSAYGAGIIFKGNDDISNLIIYTQDLDGSEVTSSINMSTGRGSDTAGSGGLYLSTGAADGSSGNSGPIAVASGTGANGNSGTIDISSGSASATSGNVNIRTGSAGTRGDVVIDAPRLDQQSGFIRFYNNSSDPAGAIAGDVYYNSISNKLKLYNGVTWETITSA